MAEYLETPKRSPEEAYRDYLFHPEKATALSGNERNALYAWACRRLQKILRDEAEEERRRSQWDSVREIPTRSLLTLCNTLDPRGTERKFSAAFLRLAKDRLNRIDVSFERQLRELEDMVKSLPAELGEAKEPLEDSLTTLRVRLCDLRCRKVCELMGCLPLPDIEQLLQRRLEEYADAMRHHAFRNGRKSLEKDLRALEESLSDWKTLHMLPRGIAAALKRAGKESVHIETKGNTATATITWEGNQWIISTFDYTPLSGEAILAVSNRKEPRKVAVLSGEKLIAALEQGAFSLLVKRAEQDFAGERNPPPEYLAYDLPKEEKAEYIRVFPRTEDTVVTSLMQGSILQTAVLADRYGKKEGYDLNLQPVLFTDDPAQDLRAKIDAAHARGRRFFWIDLYQHGSPQGWMFRTPMTAANLSRIAQDYSDCRFLVTTVACFGAGGRKGFLEEMEKDKRRGGTLARRLTVLLETKPDVPVPSAKMTNPDGGMDNDTSGSFSTHYKIAFMRRLLQGKPLGRAAWEADDEAKLRDYTNPEALFRGKLITQNAKPIRGNG